MSQEIYFDRIRRIFFGIKETDNKNQIKFIKEISPL